MTLREQLEDAERQYHLLVTGQSPRVIVDQNGERVEFNAANRGALLQYIQSLKERLNVIKTNRPAGVFF